MKKLTIIKVGGNIIDAPAALQTFLAEFAALEGPKILVHGGGKIATAVASGLGVEAVMIEGRRVTDKAMLRIVTMVYGGLINKNIVADLQHLGCNALGLTGADGALITSAKRSPNPVDYGFVGDPVSVNTATARTLLDNGLVPIVAPLTYANGEILNTNADTMAQTLATALASDYSVSLVYKFEKPGVLLDVHDDSSVIPLITPEIFDQLKSDGIVDKGMLPKLVNALKAVSDGLSSVYIGETKICSSM